MAESTETQAQDIREKMSQLLGRVVEVMNDVEKRGWQVEFTIARAPNGAMQVMMLKVRKEF